MKKSLTYLFTGNGKGKTSAALGVALRSICSNQKVAWVAWYKSEDWDISEKKLPEILDIDFHLMGQGFFVKNKKDKEIDNKSKQEHKKAAQKAFKKAEEILQSQQYFLLVCDEIINALSDGLLTFSQIKNLIKNKGKTHLILTGRSASQKLIDLVNLATEMKKLKHPYDDGISAVKGLDF